MKKGDKVYCIRDYVSVGKIINTKGKIYTVLKNRVYITVDTNYKDDMGCNTNDFKLKSNIQEYRFYDFFIELKKYRKLKLKKLYESRG